MANKFYTIHVGTSEPQLVLRGHVNKKSGNPEGKIETGYAVNGGTAIPNFSVVWARPIMGKDGKRTGELVPMKWGEAGGEATEIRHLPSCASLDKAYQTQAGLKPKDADWEIFLTTGLNEFNETLQPGLVKMLQWHTANGDSPCRDPQNTFVVYHEYDENKNITLAMKQDEVLFEAMKVVMDAKDSVSKLRVLGAIYGIPTERKDKLIHTELMAMLKANPLKFNEDRHNYLKECQRWLIKARDFQVLDLGVTGEVRIAGVDAPVLEDLPVKLSGDKKLEYMLENITDPEVFEAIHAIKKVVDQKERAFN